MYGSILKCNVLRMTLPTLEEFRKLEVLPYTRPSDPLSCTEEDVEGLFLFSQQRKSIWRCFMDWQKRVLRLFGSARFWLNGSFVTIKENPHDIDVVVIVSHKSFREAITLHSAEFADLTTHNDSDGNRVQPCSGMVDSFITVEEPEILGYWDNLWSSVNTDKHYLSDGITRKRYLEVTPA